MWFLQKLRWRAKMDSFEPESQLNNQQQHPDSLLHSDSSIDNDNKLLQLLAQDLENLVLSCNDEVIDRCIQKQSVAIEQEEQVKQAVDDDLMQLIVKEAVAEPFRAESSSGGDARQLVDEYVERSVVENVLEVDPEECRVSDEREAGESETGFGNHEEVCEDKDVDLKGKYEIEIEDGDVSSEIGDYEDNGEHVEDLRENVGGDGWEEGPESVPGGGKSKGYHYPLRPDAEDCSYYMRTGMCRFGSSCKFNHPLRRKNQAAKETKKPKEENVERRGQVDCKYHTSSTGCKYGKACKFNHGRGKTVKTPAVDNHGRGKSAKTPVVEYNFVGLPIRPGEKECPYYMRNGSCKYGPTCRFNHPDPTAVVDGDAPTSYGNDRSLPLQPAPQPNIPKMPSSSAPRTPEPPAAFVPMMYPPTQTPPSPDWNGYQASAPVPAHLYPNSEQGLPIPPAFFLINPPSATNMYTHHQQPMLVSEYPERPGQPDCSYFMKTGDCKYRTSCKFNHPQSHTTRNLKDQNICSYFSRHGTCKYGSACKYDHPVNYNSNSNPAGEGYDGSNGPRHMIQQSM